jgi:6-phosphofructokinase
MFEYVLFEFKTAVAYLHEFLRASNVPTAVTVVPSGIDGTMANKFVETSIGYHTACQVGI